MNNAGDAISAVSTLSATVVALWLGLRGVWISHKDAARKIGVWLTQRYDFNVATDSYKRFVQLHVSNEATNPYSMPMSWFSRAWKLRNMR
jgi:hypothetical protein